jgi:hypothetical protein
MGWIHVTRLIPQVLKKCVKRWGVELLQDKKAALCDMINNLKENAGQNANLSQ